MTPPENWSRINQGRGELIDHVLVSHALPEHLIQARTVPLEVPSIGVHPQTTRRATGWTPSDHRPVLARFTLSPRPRPNGAPAMRRCLIVANQTLTTDTLTRAVEDRIAAGPHEFHLVAPATPARDEVDGPAAYAALGPSMTDRAYALAEQRLGRALHHLRELGATVDGEVGDPDPLAAVRLALGRFPADEIVVSTLPRGLSPWLRRDLPARLRRSSGVPVTHLVADADATT